MNLPGKPVAILPTIKRFSTELHKVFVAKVRIPLPVLRVGAVDRIADIRFAAWR
jgi:hypothetical protein